jgi:hypothetical protein
MFKLIFFSAIICGTFAIFPNGKFNYGITYDKTLTDDTYMKYDYMSTWINSQWSDNRTKVKSNEFLVIYKEYFVVFTKLKLRNIQFNTDFKMQIIQFSLTSTPFPPLI